MAKSYLPGMLMKISHNVSVGTLHILSLRVPEVCSGFSSVLINMIILHILYPGTILPPQQFTYDIITKYNLNRM